MAVSKELTKVLNPETTVNIRKLADLAKDTNVEECRADVWRLLLGILPAKRADSIVHSKDLFNQYRRAKEFKVPQFRHQIRHDADMLAETYPELQSNTGIMAEVVTVLWSIEDSYNANTMALVRPFVSVLSEPFEVFFGLKAFLYKTRKDRNKISLACRIATFQTLFRLTLPYIYNFFNDEEIYPNEWMLEWVQGYLATSLPTSSLLPLWDTYIAMDSGVTEFHLFVCIAILQLHHEKLMDLERSEILSFLHHLPEQPMEKVVAQAHSLQFSVQRGDRPVSMDYLKKHLTIQSVKMK